MARTHARGRGLLTWDVIDAVLSPGEVILILSWLDHEAADAFADSVPLPASAASWPHPLGSTAARRGRAGRRLDAEACQWDVCPSSDVKLWVVEGLVRSCLGSRLWAGIDPQSSPGIPGFRDLH